MHRQSFNSNPLWIPKEDAGGRMKTFMEIVEEKYDIQFHDYWLFRQWTVDHMEEFWEELWDFLGILYSKRFNQVIDLSIPMEECPKWFEGARVNFAENMLRYRDDQLAIIVAGEDRDIERVTYKQLYEETRLYTAALRNFGIKKGDRVSCFISNRKEAIIGMLAVTSIGAIWVGSIVGLGSKGFLSRMKQLQPRILFTVDQYPSNNAVIDLLLEIQEIAEGMPCLEKIIIIPSKPGSKTKDISGIKRSCFLESFLQMGYNADGSIPELEFEQMSVTDPIFIVHTSGTTGAPKAIVHGSGILLTRLRDYCLHWNIQREDVWLTYPPPGWSVWNGFSMLLFFGATIVVFEGSPYFISSTYLWDLIDEVKITALTLTTRILDELEARKYLPNEKHDLSSLNVVLAYASVVTPQSFDLVMTKLKKDLTFLVMYGNSVTGKEGEFVLIKSVPSFPLFFWGDADGKNLKEYYFSKYPGKFTMGDAAAFNPVTRGLSIFGRSEETIKVKDLYFRSYDIYAALQNFTEIRDALCVAQYQSNKIDQRAVLFVKMQENYTFTDEVVQNIKKVIIKYYLSDMYVPEVIIGVLDIPYNINGKKMESLVRKIINHLPYSTEMVSNPECLKYFYNHPQLYGY